MMTNDAPIITESPPENELENGVKDDAPIISESSREIELENGAKDDSDAYSDDVSPLVSETKTDSAILSKSETRWITRAKIVVLLVILVAAVLASTGVYLSSEESEETDFQVRFDDFANQIIAVSNINANHIFQTIETTSLGFTTLSIERNYTWPFAVFDHFETTALQVIGDTGANLVGITPLVMDKDRQDYEDYIEVNQGWIPSGTNYSLEVPFIYCFTEDVDAVYDGIYPGVIPCPQAEIYAAISQISPVAEHGSFINYNGFDFFFFKGVYDGMVEVGEAVLSGVLNLIDATPLDEIKADQRLWPVSYMAAPIFETPDEGADIVALLTAELPWHSYFTNLVPEGIDGIYLVVRNTCEQEFTYRIDGPEVVYLGPTDLHRGYDDLEVSTEFTSFKSISDCIYSFHLFPSEEFEKAYQTNDPLIFAIVIFSTFMLTALVFVVYDFLVERRQKKVLTSATRTGALVNSLFPATVRDRLMDDANEVSKGKDIFTASQDKEATVGSKNIEVYKTPPIADSFPNTTVMFADLVGFTSWSSVREPSDVFTLLETLYNSFDKIARHLGVFKVETIGDCYLACCGLPEPRADHAVAMAKFSRKCLIKMSDVVHQLADALGPGTTDLAMRFGLHSGPVTGGVLRGEKSRFQLFGDTVNVAARMESTGSTNKIQVSQKTADLIISGGHPGWIKPRETLVFAKGKGELQTYWLTPQNSSSGSQTSGNQTPIRVSVD